MLFLKDTPPVAEGSQRFVFIHPENPDLIIKVIRPDAIGSSWDRWYKVRRSYGQYLSYMREIGEHVAAHAREGLCPPFVQQVRGLVDTDLGLGLVLEAVRGEDGALAPTLKSMLRQRIYDRRAEQALEVFLAQLLESDLIASDLHSGNLVYACDGENGHRFVLIDGVGQPNIIPLKRMSRTLNRQGKIRRIEKLRSQIARAQDPSLRRRPSRNPGWFRPALLGTAAAALAVFSPVFLSFVSKPPLVSGSASGMESINPQVADRGGDPGQRQDPVRKKQEMHPGETMLDTLVDLADDSRIRLAPWLQSALPFDNEDSSILKNPYSADSQEDDMMTSLEENNPIVQ